ncbi:hypothetical protein PIROE2DRAFT_4724 [Piromyces sp. E2]|nr:hypothetical protein PIROE2DRAFT_4724 [Piromyces sp. E2]|eukprot:OUM67772.1 hypothetical protein PIROE2DRAFT_4724 [Piromyces sp. E2]
MFMEKVVDLEEPLVFTNDKYCHDKTTIINIHESLNKFGFSKYIITDEKDNEIFKFKLGSGISKRDLTDLQGRSLISFKFDILSIKLRANIIGKSGKKIGKLECPKLMSGKKYCVYITYPGSGKEEYFEMRQENTKTSDIYHGKREEGAPLVAKIKRIYDNKISKFISFIQNYTIEIGPNVDSALIVLLALIFDITRTS